MDTTSSSSSSDLLSSSTGINTRKRPMYRAFCVAEYGRMMIATMRAVAVVSSPELESNIDHMSFVYVLPLRRLTLLASGSTTVMTVCFWLGRALIDVRP